MTFDFNKIKKSYLTVTLLDTEKEKKETILVKMPMKKTFEKMVQIQKQDTEDMPADEVMNLVSGIVASILSNNMQKKKISAQIISDNYTLEEQMMLIDKFMEFTDTLSNDPN